MTTLESHQQVDVAIEAEVPAQCGAKYCEPADSVLRQNAATASGCEFDAGSDHQGTTLLTQSELTRRELVVAADLVDFRCDDPVLAEELTSCAGIRCSS